MGSFPSKEHQFRKGTSGNPQGRATYRARAEALLDQAATDQSLKAIWANLVKMAEAGDLAATKLLLERLAPATERREVEHVDPAPLPELEAALARIEATAGANGAGGEPVVKPTNGSGGSVQ